MSNNFQQTAEHNSAGSLLLGAIFGGMTSELGQAVDMASDAAEIASEIHTHYDQKAQNKSFTLGQKKSLGGTFANKVSGMQDDKPAIQTRYLNLDYTYAPKRTMGMSMAA